MNLNIYYLLFHEDHTSLGRNIEKLDIEYVDGFVTEDFEDTVITDNCNQYFYDQ